RCVLEDSFCSDAGERLDLEDLLGLFRGANTLWQPALLSGFHRAQKGFAQQNHSAIRCSEMLLPPVNGTLSSLGHNVFVTYTPPKRHVLSVVIFFLVLQDGRRTSLGQLRKKILIRPRITIRSKEHEMIVVVRRGEHDMFNVTALRQCRGWLVEM